MVGPFGEAVAAILKDATHSRDTRLQVIGDHAGLSVAQVSRMLNGQKVITLDEYVSICESLKLDPEKVFAEARLTQAVPPHPAPADGVVVTFPATPPAEDDEDEPDWTTFAARTNPHHDQEITERTGWRDDLGEETQVGPDWDKED